MIKIKEENKKEKIYKIEDNVPMASDVKFKKMFGDNDGIERLEMFISIFFDLPLETVKGNVTVLNSEKTKDYRKERVGAMDVYLSLRLTDHNERIDIEVSNEILRQTTIDRNIGFGAHKYQAQLKKSMKYTQLEPMIEIWFDKGLQNIDEGDSIVEEYYYRNSKGEILTKKTKINHINIEKCYNIWHTNSVQKFSEYEQKIIYFGAMLCTKNKEEFKKCLEELPMGNEIREDIEKTNDALNEDEDVMNWYSHERELQIRAEGTAHDMAQEIAEDMAKDMAKGIAKDMAKDMAQDIAKNIVKNEKLEIARKLLAKGTSINEVINITNLSKNEIEKLQNKSR